MGHVNERIRQQQRRKLCGQSPCDTHTCTESQDSLTCERDDDEGGKPDPEEVSEEVEEDDDDGEDDDEKVENAATDDNCEVMARTIPDDDEELDNPSAMRPRTADNADAEAEEEKARCPCRCDVRTTVAAANLNICAPKNKERKVFNTFCV